MSDNQPQPPLTNDERTSLETFLDVQRAAFIRKCADLTTEQSLEPLMPSSPLMTLFGLAKHLRSAEWWWCTKVLAGADEEDPFGWTDEDPDAEFRHVEGETIGSVLAEYESECARSRAVTSSMGLDDLALMKDRAVSVRWVLLHLIEETARHDGHADLLREAVDGLKGC